MLLETHIKLWVAEPDFLEIIFPKYWENEPKMRQKQGF